MQANESITKMMVMRVVLRLTKQGEKLKTLKDDEEFFKTLYTNAPIEPSQDENSTERTLMPESLSVLPDCFTKMKQEEQDQKIREAVRLLLILQQASFFEQSGEPFDGDANVSYLQLIRLVLGPFPSDKNSRTTSNLCLVCKMNTGCSVFWI